MSIPDSPLFSKRSLVEGFQLLHTEKSQFVPRQPPGREALQQNVAALKKQNTLSQIMAPQSLHDLVCSFSTIQYNNWLPPTLH